MDPTMIAARRFLANISSPLLLASYPAIFLYHQNAAIVSLSSLLLPLSVSIVICLLCYAALVFSRRRSLTAASNGTLGLLTVFFLYGPVRDLLTKLDLVPVRDATLLPGMLLAGLYLARFLWNLKAPSADSFRRWARFTLGILVAYNALAIAAIELRKASKAAADHVRERIPLPLGDVSRGHPDIYFIVLDEFAGPYAARKYWGDGNVDEFEGFLTQRGFHLSRVSQSATLDTRVEVASRLNYKQYEIGLDPQFYFGEIANNRVMLELGRMGYETVAFEGMRSQLFYPAMAPMQADHNLEYDSGRSLAIAGYFDPFANLFLNLTILRPVSDVNALYGASIARHIGEVRYAFGILAKLSEIPSPKFVYAHIMLPHEPFVFRQDGAINEPECHFDWGCYYGNYVYSMSLLEGLVDELLEEADPENPPIIALQSDHGARNIPYMEGDTGTLPNYPQEYAYSILNAIYLPGGDYSDLRDDTAPIDTFPLIFNRFFGYQLPIH
jgi:hypothetical protein